jgi:hypothetical protein
MVETKQCCYRFRVFGWFSAFASLFFATSVQAAFQSHNHVAFELKGRRELWKPPRRALSPGTSIKTYRSEQRAPVDSFRLYSRPQDNLVAGIAEIGFAFTLGVLWSEYGIILTGCGPLNFSDTLERICYQGVIVVAGVALFNRIVSGTNLAETSEKFFGPLEEFTLWQVRVVEWASALAVLGAFLSLAFQYSRGTNMDGLSGIDIGMCRALRDL